MSIKGFFITGTDTGVGKTAVAAAALVLLRSRGIDAVPMKPVQTGAEFDGKDWRSPDLDFCLRASGMAPAPEEYRLMSRYRLALPASPHLAAAEAGAAIEISEILCDFFELRRAHAVVAVEGAGGVLAPLNENEFMLELMQALGLPVVLVARAGLGTLNHTLLSLRELRRAGVNVAGVVFNDAQPAQPVRIEQDNRRVIERLGGAIVPVHLPYFENLGSLARLPQSFLAAIESFRDGFESLFRTCSVSMSRRMETAGADISSLWHPYTRHSAQRDDGLPVIVRGEGVFLYDKSGRQYFDAISSWWACALGHGHPRLLRAIREQLPLLQHSILGGMSHPRAAELAARLSALLGGGRRVLFASDGACAVEAALKIALQYRHNIGEPERRKFVSFTDAYHGDTLGAVAVGYLPAFHKPFEPMLPTSALRVEPPRCHACPWGGTLKKCGLECFRQMRDMLEQHGSELTAVIVEPMCRGAAGMRIYPARYLAELAECCRAAEVLLIVDEIATGFGRTGRMFAHEHAGIEPDIVCVGKALSGGCLPISATIVKGHIFETFGDGERDNTFYHGHTFCGNPIAAAAALEALRIYEEENIAWIAAAMQELFEAETARFSGIAGVIDVRCLGAIWAVELGPAESEGARRAAAVAARMRERGVLLRPLGPVLYFMPPLITPRETLRRAISELRDALAAAQS